MFRHLVVSFIICLALIPSGTSAGYTDELWNESEARVYFDCGDWSGVDNHKHTALSSHYYFYSKHRRNWPYMTTPKNWGYPSDAKLRAVGFSDIAWSAVHIHGFDKTLDVDGVVYTDDPEKINYKTSYLQYKGWTTRHWDIYDITYAVTKSSDGGRVTVANWITFHGKHAKEGKDDYRKVISTPSDHIDYTRWDAPDLKINVTITKHRGYNVLEVPTPNDITGIRITSADGTTAYEKHSHCLRLNSTGAGFQYYDLVDYDYCSFSGIFPYGANEYLIDGGQQNLLVELFTPFGSYPAELFTTTIDESDYEKLHLKNHPLYALAMFLVPILLSIWLYRRL